MLTIMVFGENMVAPIRIISRATIDITDSQQATLLAKSIVETCTFVSETIASVSGDIIDMIIETTAPDVRVEWPMFYSDN